MKHLFLMSLFCFSIFSCNFLTLQNDTPIATELHSENWVYLSSSPQYRVNSDVGSVTIENAVPVDIFMARMNPSKVRVSKLNTRFISSVITEGANLSSNSYHISEINAEIDTVVNFDNDKKIQRVEFNPPVIILEDEEQGLRTADDNLEILRDVENIPEFVNNSNEPVEISKSINSIIPVIDITTKLLWVDVAPNTPGSIAQSDGLFYMQKEATLRAVGLKCYVWVVNENFSNSTNDNYMVNSSEAQKIASLFDQVYEVIRHVFGHEADYMFMASHQRHL